MAPRQFNKGIEQLVNGSLPKDEFIISRRKSRTLALQMLYEIDSVSHHLDGVLNRHNKRKLARETITFATNLVEDVVTNTEYIDMMISKFATSWPIAQLSIVDRNILRLAICELTMIKSSPPKVVINEALELAKVFGSENSSKFINGVLGSIMETEELRI